MAVLRSRNVVSKCFFSGQTCECFLSAPLRVTGMRLRMNFQPWHCLTGLIMCVKGPHTDSKTEVWVVENSLKPLKVWL